MVSHTNDSCYRVKRNCHSRTCGSYSMMINELRYSSWGSKMDNLGSRNSTDMIAMRTKDSSERFGVLSFVQKSTFYKDGLGGTGVCCAAASGKAICTPQIYPHDVTKNQSKRDRAGQHDDWLRMSRLELRGRRSTKQHWRLSFSFRLII